MRQIVLPAPECPAARRGEGSMAACTSPAFVGPQRESARGRDAADVAISMTFGPNTLASFKVWTDEVQTLAA